MREHVEKMIADYPKMLGLRAALKNQIERYRPVSTEDVIESMTFSQPSDDRVQTSTISDKTCRIALLYRDRVNQLNEEMIGTWVKEYSYLDEEIGFLESSIRKLPDNLQDVMSLLVLDGDTWDEVEGCLRMNRKAIASCRREALGLLTVEYQKRASQIEAVILS